MVSKAALRWVVCNSHGLVPFYIGVRIVVRIGVRNSYGSVPFYIGVRIGVRNSYRSVPSLPLSLGRGTQLF